ncbi:hypothetical protein [Burkholderia puraquae]|uniref:hypothetical protein n=1 Tax=Burkholderia puraquae TaxID=1904757 RepID=UPI0013FD961D|nr:hypothetical protein [Burkholderia puraquae]
MSDAQYRNSVAEGRERVAHLMPVLRQPDTLWHRTDIAGLKSILADGAIRPNDGTIPSQYTTSEDVGHAGYRFGGVCLFDFHSPALDDVYWAAQHWHQFFSQCHPLTIVFEIARDRLNEAALILQSGKCWMPPLYHPPRGGAHYPRWIPYVEAWHRGPISLQDARRILAFRSGSDDKFDQVEIGTETSSDVERLAAEWTASCEAKRARALAEGGIDLVAALAKTRAGLVRPASSSVKHGTSPTLPDESS